MKNINQNMGRIILTLKDSSIITLDKVPLSLAKKTKEYLEKLKQAKPSKYLSLFIYSAVCAATHLDIKLVFHGFCSCVIINT